MNSADAWQAEWDVSITGMDGQVALEMLGCCARRYEASAVSGGGPARLTEVLRAMPLPDAPAAPSALHAPQEVVAAWTANLATPQAQAGQDVRYALYRDGVLELIAHLAAAAVVEILPGAQVFTVKDLLTKGVKDVYAPFLDTLLALAARHGLMAAGKDGTWKLVGTPAPEQHATWSPEAHGTSRWSAGVGLKARKRLCCSPPCASRGLT